MTWQVRLFSSGRNARVLLDNLGIASFLDVRRRYAEVESYRLRVWDLTEAIMAVNPEIEDDGTPGHDNMA